MTYNELNNKIVKEKGWVTSKKFKVMLVELALTCLTGGYSLSLLVSAVSNTLYSIFVFIIMVLSYIWLLDYCDEDEKNFNFVRKFSHGWLGISVLIVIEVIVLKYFNFI